MKQLDQDRLDKLPKWAQDHVQQAYKRIESLEREKSTWFGEAEEDPQVYLVRFHGSDGRTEDDQPLAFHQRVRFYPKGRQNSRWQDYIEFGLELENERVVVHAGGCLSIHPAASNCAFMTVES